MIKIGLLDFGIRDNKKNSGLQSLYDVVDYAVRADELGFNRFWMAEKYNFDYYSGWSNPEVLVPVIAGMTEQIRVGMAGILLPFHSPFRVSLNFKLLNNLFSNRIDLGLAKGVVHEKIGEMLNPQINEGSFFSIYEKKVEELIKYFRNEIEYEKKYILLPPYKGDLPELWSLGSSYRGLPIALKYKTNFSRSIFHQEADKSYQKDILDGFKEDFYSLYHEYPKITLAFSGCCSKSSSIRSVRNSYHTHSDKSENDNIIGPPSLFFDQLNAYQEQYGINEFIFYNTEKLNEKAIEGIELISEVFNLKENHSNALL